MPTLFPFCLLNQRARGQTVVYFSLTLFIWHQTRDRSLETFFQPMPAWLTETKQAQITIWAALALPGGGLGHDTVHLTPDRKLFGKDILNDCNILKCLSAPHFIDQFCFI